MERKEFLAMLGLGTTAVMVGCLSACKKPANSGPTNVDFTIDLNDAIYAALKNPGWYIYKNEVIVAKTINGTYIAVAATCPHQGEYVEYIPSADHFHCYGHGANFSDTGALLNGPAKASLNQYKVTLTGNSLHVTSWKSI